jgi:hypothetical protein
MAALCIATACVGATHTAAASEPAGGSRLLLRLDPEAVRRVGVELETAVASRYEPELLAYGRALDPAPAVAAVARHLSAVAQADRADRDLRRIEALARGDQNASARELEAARAAASTADADLDATEAAVVALLGAEIAGDPRLPAWTHEMTRRSRALLRVDVPAGSRRPDPAKGAGLRVYPESGAPLRAEYIGPAPAADPMLPGWGFLFWVAGDGAPPPGTPIRAHIRTDGETLQGVDVPATALIREGGAIFVFIARGKGVFERVAIDATSRGDARWFVASGVEPGDRVVVTGAQQLLSAQTFSAGPGSKD